MLVHIEVNMLVSSLIFTTAAEHPGEVSNGCSYQVASIFGRVSVVSEGVRRREGQIKPTELNDEQCSPGIRLGRKVTK